MVFNQSSKVEDLGQFTEGEVRVVNHNISHLQFMDCMVFREGFFFFFGWGLGE